MSARRSSVTSSSRAARGYTLPEVLVYFALGAIVAAGVGAAYVFATRGWSDQRARLQTQQQLRSAIAALSREVRLAGACMLPSSTPSPASFRPLDGVNNGTTDTITVRANPRCLKVALSQGCSQCTTITVVDTTGFAAGMRAYILRNDLTGGEPFTIQSVTSNTITATQALAGSYPVPDGNPNPSSVFGIDVRTFAISSTCGDCGGIPTLTLQTLDVAAPVALVKGIDRLDIHYILNRDYVEAGCVASTGGERPLCVVDLPASSADWTLVRAVTFDLGARSIRPVRAAGSVDGVFRLGEVFAITPRNFVFSIGRL
jgi:type II secretory pathway pseudopilin PulG